MNKAELDQLVPYELIRDWEQHFYQTETAWERRRAERLDIEKDFEHFTGHIDVVELHIPYTKYQYAFRMMHDSQYRIGQKGLVLAGDNINLDMFSYFYKTSADFNLPIEELENLVKFLHVAQKIYDWIVVMIDNHDNRVFKVIYKMAQSKEQAEQLTEWMKGYADIFTDAGLDKVIVMESELFQIGDVLITHFENNSVVPGNTSRELIDYLGRNVEKKWNVFFQAHTHFQLKMALNRKIAIETGALQKIPDYMRRGKMRMSRKGISYGYSMFDMIGGEVDPNRANFVFCEWEDYL